MAAQAPVRILIVDDEPDIAVILRLHLEDCGFSSDWAGDGNSAWEMLCNGGYALALMDIRMPGMNGVDLLKRINENGMELAVIMMTAHGNEELAVECMKAGAFDYVSKPFSPDDLLQRVERALSIQQSLKEKKQLEQEKSDFYNMLSHDLKNPITAVIGSIDIMREGRLGPVNSEQEEYLQSAIDSCNEIVTMIDNLLDVQRFEADRMPLSLSSCNASELAASAVQRFLRAAELYDISLTLTPEDTSSQIVADRNVMGRVFANLLVNAIKFTPEGGTIVVSNQCIENSQLHRIDIPEYVHATEALYARGCCVKFSVTDSGEGIPAEDLGRVFERYTQSHNATAREKGGAGLGLAFCKKAVESFDGVIWAESTPEDGSTFIILLPCDPGGSSGRTKT